MIALTERQTKELLLLISEIEAEARGHDRKPRMTNLHRRVRLILNNGKRNSRKQVDMQTSRH